MATRIEVASLLSRLDFEIDEKPLEKFLGLTRLVRESSAKLARNLRVTNTQLSGVSAKLKSVNNGLNSVNSRKGAGNLSSAYASLSKNVNIANGSLTRISSTLTAVEPKLVQQNVTMGSLVGKWALYAQKVKDANTNMRGLRASGGHAPPRVGTGGAQATQKGAGGAGSGLMGGVIGANLGKVLNPALLGAGSAGYAVKEVVRVGREYMKMENVLLASSKSADEFNEHLKYVEKTTDRLGTNVSEFGSAYAKMLQATAGKLNNKQTQEIFTNFSELMVVLGSSDDDQKGIFRAMSQVFSKGKIQMEEINQMAERNVPALAMLTRAWKELGWTQAEFEKKQQKGQLDPSQFMPLFAKYAKEFANNNGALEKALEQSQTKQGQFMNNMRKMSKEIMDAGLDKLISQMFTGLNSLATVMKPVVVWLIQVVSGFVEFIKVLRDFSAEYPIVSGILLAMIGLFGSYKLAVRTGMLGFGAFASAMILGLKAIKMALLRTAIFALFIGIAEVLVSLYEHMNGKANWLSVTIAWFELLGAKIEMTWARFRLFFAQIKAGFAESAIGRLVSKILGVDLQAEVDSVNKASQYSYLFPRKKDTKIQDRLNKSGVKTNVSNTAWDYTKVPALQTSVNRNITSTTNVNLTLDGKEMFKHSDTQPFNLGGLGA